MPDSRMPEDRKPPKDTLARVMQAAEELDARRQEQVANQIKTINGLKLNVFTAYRILNYVMVEHDIPELLITDDGVQSQPMAEVLEDEDAGMWHITRRNP
jgi:hypothetical protein